MRVGAHRGPGPGRAVGVARKRHGSQGRPTAGRAIRPADGEAANRELARAEAFEAARSRTLERDCPQRTAGDRDARDRGPGGKPAARRSLRAGKTVERKNSVIFPFASFPKELVARAEQRAFSALWRVTLAGAGFGNLVHRVAAGGGEEILTVASIRLTTGNWRRRGGSDARRRRGGAGRSGAGELPGCRSAGTYGD